MFKSFETKILINKVIKTETTLYALGKLRTKENTTPLTTTNNKNNNNNNKCNQLVDSKFSSASGDNDDSGGGGGSSNSNGYNLYKFTIDETIKNTTQLEHQLVLSDLNLNTNKMAIVVDSEVK